LEKKNEALVVELEKSMKHRNEFGTKEEAFRK